MNNSKEKNSLWYKDAIIYQIHIKSFADSNEDGIGDFQGLIQKLDYIQFLGINTIWLLPFYPSPLKDDGYDIVDFTSVNPIYGTMKDFKLFLKEAHKRKIRVMTELVLNHTSNLNPWFLKSRSAPPNSRWRKYYVWSDNTDRYQEARIIFKDFETSNWTWDSEANAYFWHRFYSHQPDLNYENPEVKNAMKKIVDFWFRLGVDGLRLDAVPYLFESEGTSCENLPETHQYLKELRAYIDENYQDKFLLAEANQWPEDAVEYFGKGDECQMVFNFPVMPRMYMSIQMEDRFPIIDILQQTPNIPDNCQWATFLRNHDELTLEMVSDQERDYMYRMYAKDIEMRINLGIRRRLAPLMEGDRRKIELMNGLLFSLPGTPIIYYGDEISMGDNIYLGDRNGVRTPMQWSSDKNAGFSKATPQKLYLPVIIDPEYNYEMINVEIQKYNSQSLLWWMKKLIELRKNYKAFSRGEIKFLLPDNTKILSFLRTYQYEKILVIINLSRTIQFAELDLLEFSGYRLIELFGEIEFPVITKELYFFSLNAYSFMYFKICEIAPSETTDEKSYEIPSITVSNNQFNLFELKSSNQLNFILSKYLYHCRWFRSKSRKISTVNIIDIFLLIKSKEPTYFIILEIDYNEGESETYSMFISLIDLETSIKLQKEFPNAVIAFLKNKNKETKAIIDTLLFNKACFSLLKEFTSKKNFKGSVGQVVVKSPINLKRFDHNMGIDNIKPLQVEQSNTSIIFDNKYVLKFFRKSEAGINPELELSTFLTEKTAYDKIPKLLLTMEYVKKNKIFPLGILQEYIINEGDAWKFTLNALPLYFERVLAKKLNFEKLVLPPSPTDEIVDVIPSEAHETIGPFFDSARLLGLRTAELHLALGSSTTEKEFKLEEFTSWDQRSLYQSIRGLSKRALHNLQKKLKLLMENKINELERSEIGKETKNDIISLINHQEKFIQFTQDLLKAKVNGKKIRCHGDLHLGQILFNGKDFIIIDFEGEPQRSLNERRIKRSPLKDVAGMLRSFHYAVYTVIFEKFSHATEDELALLEFWGIYWYRWICQIFIKSYQEKIQGSELLPNDKNTFLLLLKYYMLEKAIYELNYEIDNRPRWIKIPCRGLLELIGKIDEAALKERLEKNSP